MYFSIPNFYLNYNESGLWHNATLKIRTTSNKWVLCSHSHLQKNKNKHEGKRPTAVDTTKVTTTVFVAGVTKSNNNHYNHRMEADWGKKSKTLQHYKSPQ